VFERWFKREPDGLFGDGERVKTKGIASAIESPIQAPLSGKPCFAWSMRIVRSAGSRQSGLGLGLIGAASGLAKPLLTTADLTSDDPDFVAGKREWTRFAAETKRGRVEVVLEGLVLDGAPLPIIPRNIKREYALVAEWGLTERLPDLWDFEFQEVIVAPGQKLDVEGVIAHDGDGLRLAQARIRVRY
jgi:hypothetical protein